MHTEDIYGLLGVSGVIFLVIYAILLFFLPFYVYGAWYRAREIAQKMELNNERLAAILQALERNTE